MYNFRRIQSQNLAIGFNVTPKFDKSSPKCFLAKQIFSLKITAPTVFIELQHIVNGFQLIFTNFKELLFQRV